MHCYSPQLISSAPFFIILLPPCLPGSPLKNQMLPSFQSFSESTEIAQTPKTDYPVSSEHEQLLVTREDLLAEGYVQTKKAWTEE